MTTPARIRARRAFAGVAMALVVLYVVVDVVLQLLPPHYSAVSDAESDLAVGPFGWAMNLNFLARAVMSGCVIAAICLTAPSTAARRWGIGLLSVAGLCSAALVFAPTDVNAPGEFGMRPHSAIGVVHVSFATAGFIAVLAAMTVLTVWNVVVTGRRMSVLFLWIAWTGLALLAATLIAAPPVVGLAERLCLVGILGWAFATCAGIRRLR